MGLRLRQELLVGVEGHDLAGDTAFEEAGEIEVAPPALEEIPLRQGLVREGYPEEVEDGVAVAIHDGQALVEFQVIHLAAPGRGDPRR